MLDRLALPLIAVTAIAVVALAMVWPQGYGARSPAPFGHTPIQQTPEIKAALKREHDLAMQRAADAAAAAPVPAVGATPVTPMVEPAAPLESVPLRSAQ
jgi:hypothetical protein